MSKSKTNSSSPELAEIVQHIKRILPDQKSLTHLHANEESNFVEFVWHSRHFVVRPNLEALELKGKTLMITGASQLMQAALRTKDRNAKIVAAILETLTAAEENMRAHPDKAYALLKQVKTTMQRLAGKPAAPR